MAQASFSELEHDLKKRRTRRELFLEKMDKLFPWERLERRIEPFYPKAGRGRRPYPLGVMLRVHCVQLFYNLSDPGMEDLLYEVESVRRFVGLRLTEALPDETTILNFRHLTSQDGSGYPPLGETSMSGTPPSPPSAQGKGCEGRWLTDLALERFGSEQDPQAYWLAPMHYFWPEVLW